jgi:hypothetical protein
VLTGGRGCAFLAFFRVISRANKTARSAWVMGLALYELRSRFSASMASFGIAHETIGSDAGCSLTMTFLADDEMNFAGSKEEIARSGSLGRSRRKITAWGVRRVNCGVIRHPSCMTPLTASTTLREIGLSLLLR